MPVAQTKFGRSAGLVPFLICILILATWWSPARAHDRSLVCSDFAQTLYGGLDFRGVELISRNHNFGLYRGGDIRLSPWIQVGDGAFLGVDRDGRLMQVLQLSDRTVGYQLSEAIGVRDFFFAPPSNLFAVDINGQLYKFHWSEWSKSGAKNLLWRAARNSGVGICTAALGSMLMGEALGLAPLSSPVILHALGLSSVVMMVQGLLFAQRFETDNERTNGLIPVAVQIGRYKTSEYVYGPEGTIVDYRMIADKGTFSLRELVGQFETNEQNFDKTCEHELLARGIPPHNYEP